MEGRACDWDSGRSSLDMTQIHCFSSFVQQICLEGPEYNLNKDHHTHLNMGLHLLLFTLEDLVSFFFFFDPGFQVMEDLLELLLLGGKPGSHLFGLGEELCLGLKLLGEDVLLFQELQSQRVPGTVTCCPRAHTRHHHHDFRGQCSTPKKPRLKNT